MSDGRFYTVCLLAFAVLITALLLVCDSIQPNGLNWELAKEVLKIVGMIVPALLILMNLNAGRRDVQEVRQEVKATKQAAVDAVETASLLAPPKQ